MADDTAVCLGMIYISVKGSNLHWEKMGVGLNKKAWLGLPPPRVFVFLVVYTVATRTDAALVFAALELWLPSLAKMKGE